MVEPSPAGAASSSSSGGSKSGSAADAELSTDALVDLGNVLSSWAELLELPSRAAEALQLLQRAAAAYKAALQRQGGDDYDTLSNLADALVQQGHVHCDAGQGGEGQAAYERALKVGVRRLT